MIKKKWFKNKKRKKKSIFKNRFFWFITTILIISIILFYIICLYSYFAISEIKIFGNQKVSTEEIETLIQKEISTKILFLESRSIFLISLKSINREILDKFPKIDRVDFDRDFPNSLIVSIKEREPVAILSVDNNNCIIDYKGVMFEKTPEINNEQLLVIKAAEIESEITLGKTLISASDMSKILEIQSELKELELDINFVEIAKDYRVNVELLEGWKIYFDSENDVSRQILNLNLVLKEKILPEERENLEYVDLRFGNQIYYK